MEKINYQKVLDATLSEITSENRRPSLLLHACCAPCSSYVIEYLSRFFDITLLYYNPNISPEDEYRRRADELHRLIAEMDGIDGVKAVTAPYSPDEFYGIAKGLETLPEGGERCFKCYRLRLEYSVKYAKERGYDFFTTTLSISPHKNAEVLNSTGKELSEEYGVPYLFSDFKKKNGYKRSTELSERYGLYRQDYCGCVYSKMARERDVKNGGSKPPPYK